MKIVFVGFKVNQDKSVMYKKIEIDKVDEGKSLINPIEEIVSMDLGKPLYQAIKKDCDFVSIRFIKTDE